MKTEHDIRQMLKMLRAFSQGAGENGAQRVLEWVLGEYPPPMLAALSDQHGAEVAGVDQRASTVAEEPQ